MPDTDPSKVAVPWYKSKILQGIITIAITQILNRVQTLYHFDTTLLGFGINDIVAWVMDVISAGAALYLAHARVTQTTVPVMTASKAAAEAINIEAAQSAPPPGDPDVAKKADLLPADPLGAVPK